MSLRKVLLSSCFIVGLTVTAANAAHVDVNLDIGAPPPPPQVEVIPPQAPPGYIWAPGYWSYQGPQPIWVAGHWMPGRPGYHWVPEHWVQHGPRYHFVPGFWAVDAPPPPPPVAVYPAPATVIIEGHGGNGWRH